MVRIAGMSSQDRVRSRIRPDKAPACAPEAGSKSRDYPACQAG
jgi:hypothetical protein